MSASDAGTPVEGFWKSTPKKGKCVSADSPISRKLSGAHWLIGKTILAPPANGPTLPGRTVPAFTVMTKATATRSKHVAPPAQQRCDATEQSARKAIGCSIEHSPLCSLSASAVHSGLASQGLSSQSGGRARSLAVRLNHRPQPWRNRRCSSLLTPTEPLRPPNSSIKYLPTAHRKIHGDPRKPIKPSARYIPIPIGRILRRVLGRNRRCSSAARSHLPLRQVGEGARRPCPRLRLPFPQLPPAPHNTLFAHCKQHQHACAS